jgi:hypothetical protein
MRYVGAKGFFWVRTAEVRNAYGCSCTPPHSFMPCTGKILTLPCRACYMVGPFCSCWFDRRNNVRRNVHYGNPCITCFSLLLVGFQYPECLLAYEFFLRQAQAFVALSGSRYVVTQRFKFYVRVQICEGWKEGLNRVVADIFRTACVSLWVHTLLVISIASRFLQRIHLPEKKTFLWN